MQRPTHVLIPSEQLPMNEYEELRASSFFHWATLEPRRYWGGMGLVWLGSWVIGGPVAHWSYPPLKMPLEFGLAGSAIASVALLLVVARLFLGWSYIYDRLSRAQVDYEETGAHDGDVWVKPDEVWAKDQLVVQYQLTPLLKRLRFTISVLGAMASLNALLFWLAY